MFGGKGCQGQCYAPSDCLLFSLPSSELRKQYGHVVLAFHAKLRPEGGGNTYPYGGIAIDRLSIVTIVALPLGCNAPTGLTCLTIWCYRFVTDGSTYLCQSWICLSDVMPQLVLDMVNLYGWRHVVDRFLTSTTAEAARLFHKGASRRFHC